LRQRGDRRLKETNGGAFLDDATKRLTIREHFE